MKVVDLTEAKTKAARRKAAIAALRARGPVSREKTLASLKGRVKLIEEILGVKT